MGSGLAAGLGVLALLLEEARAFLETVPNARVEKPFEAEALRAAVARSVG